MVQCECECECVCCVCVCVCDENTYERGMCITVDTLAHQSLRNPLLQVRTNTTTLRAQRLDHKLKERQELNSSALRNRISHVGIEPCVTSFSNASFCYTHPTTNYRD